MAETSVNERAEEVFTQSVLICVTDQMQSIDLIRLGRKVNPRAEIRVVCAIPPGSSPNTAALDALFEICKEADATMTVAFSAQAVPTIVRVAKRRGVRHIIMGRSASNDSDPILPKVAALLPEAKVYWLSDGVLVSHADRAQARSALCMA